MSDHDVTVTGAAETRSGDLSMGRPITVVIVDDHLLVADSVAASLDASPDVTVVAIAGTCATGLEEVRRHQPDVLLLDQRLPDGLGTDSLPGMHLASPRTRVLLVTGADTDDVLLRAIEGGAAGFIAKGQRAAALLDAVRRAAVGETVLSTADLRRLMPQLVHPPTRLGDDLTAREREVLELLLDGCSTVVLARKLAISHATARNHIQSVISKLGAHSKLEAVSVALRERIVVSR
jgi:DNA-binding NarL/FixJ family response regulator